MQVRSERWLWFFSAAAQDRLHIRIREAKVLSACRYSAKQTRAYFVTFDRMHVLALCRLFSDIVSGDEAYTLHNPLWWIRP